MPRYSGGDSIFDLIQVPSLLISPSPPRPVALTTPSPQYRGWRWPATPRNFASRRAIYRWISRTVWWILRRCATSCHRRAFWATGTSLSARANEQFLTLETNCTVWLTRSGGAMRRNQTKTNISWTDDTKQWFLFEYYRSIPLLFIIYRCSCLGRIAYLWNLFRGFLLMGWKILLDLVLDVWSLNYLRLDIQIIVRNWWKRLEFFRRRLVHFWRFDWFRFLYLFLLFL